MKKIVGLMLMLALALCSAGAWAASVNGEHISSGSEEKGWELKGGLLNITKAGTYEISDWEANYQQIFVGAGVEGDITLKLRNVKINGGVGQYALAYSGLGKMNVDLDAASYLTGVRAYRFDSKPIDVAISGSGTIDGGIKRGVSLESSGGSITAVVGGSVQIKSGDDGIYAVSYPATGSSGNVNVNIGGGVRIESDYDGIYAVSQTATGSSGDVSVSVGPGAVITAWQEGIEAMSQTINRDPLECKSGKVSVTVDGASITGGTSIFGHGIAAISSVNNGSDSGEVLVSVRGGAKIASERALGINAGSTYRQSVVMLGDNVTVQGEDGAVVMGNNGELNIDGQTHRGIMLLAGENVTNAKRIGVYESLVDVYGNPDVQDAKYIATQTANEGGAAGGEQAGPMPEQIGSLPQTGDSSSLALWGALLALTGAGMAARRKREA